MKKLLCFTLGILIACAGLVLAAGDMPYHKGEIVQNVKGIATSTSLSRCDTVIGTKGVFKTYTTAGYRAAEAEVYDSTGTATTVKWYLDGKLIAIGPSVALTNPDRSDLNQFKTLAYGAYSTTSRALDSCRRGQ